MGLHLFERAHRFADNLAGLLGNRLALFGLELQEELDRLLGHLAVLLVAGVFAAFALLFATLAALVLAARNDCLLGATLVVAFVYALAALICGFWLRRRLQAAPAPFTATREEFERDRAVLRSHPESDA